MTQVEYPGEIKQKDFSGKFADRVYQNHFQTLSKYKFMSVCTNMAVLGPTSNFTGALCYDARCHEATHGVKSWKYSCGVPEKFGTLTTTG